MSYTSLIQQLKRLADGYVPLKNPTTESQNNNPNLSPQKPLKEIMYTEAPFVSQRHPI